tara:strand:- start:292 stop:930 length:639 start_codon:yes stop_codon:yes gene_type:complete
MKKKVNNFRKAKLGYNKCEKLFLEYVYRRKTEPKHSKNKILTTMSKRAGISKYKVKKAISVFKGEVGTVFKELSMNNHNITLKEFNTALSIDSDSWDDACSKLFDVVDKASNYRVNEVLYIMVNMVKECSLDKCIELGKELTHLNNKIALLKEQNKSVQERYTDNNHNETTGSKRFRKDILKLKKVIVELEEENELLKGRSHGLFNWNIFRR